VIYKASSFAPYYALHLNGTLCNAKVKTHEAACIEIALLEDSWKSFAQIPATIRHTRPDGNNGSYPIRPFHSSSGAHEEIRFVKCRSKTTLTNTLVLSNCSTITLNCRAALLPIFSLESKLLIVRLPIIILSMATFLP
jgi:hypothetical protein